MEGQAASRTPVHADTMLCQRHSMTSKDDLGLQQGPDLTTGVKINRLWPDTLFSGNHERRFRDKAKMAH